MTFGGQPVTELIASAYYRAAKDSRNDMSLVTELLEKIRTHLEQRKDKPFEAWNGLYPDRYRFDKDGMVEVVVDLKKKYYESYYAAVREQLLQNFKYEQWLSEYVDALIYLAGTVFNPLCLDEYPFTKAQQEEVGKFRQMNAYIMDGRWVEVYTIAEELMNNHSLSAFQRSSMLVNIGQVQLYWFPDYLDAERHFTAAAKTDAANSIVDRGWGTYYMKLGDFEKARQCFARATEKDNTDVENYVLTGDCYKEEGKNEIAEQWYRNAWNMDFTHASPYSKMIQLYGAWDGAPEKTALVPELVKKTEQLFPDGPYANMLYCIYRDAAAAYSATENYEEGKEYCHKAISMKPELTAANIDLAYIHAYQKDFTTAEKIFRELLGKDKKYYEVRFGLAWLYEQAGRKNDALLEYEECIQLRPGWADRSYNSMAIIYDTLEKRDKAREYYKKAIALRPAETVYYDNLLLLLEKEKDPEAIETIYLQRFSIAPQDAVWANKTGLFYFEQKNYDKAIEYYQKAIAVNPGYNVYHENIGLAYEEKGLSEHAEQAYLKALELNAEYQSYNRLGIYYYRRNKEGDMERSAAYYEKAIALKPDHAILYENAGLVYEALEDWEQAEAFYKKALDLSNEYSFYNRLGIFYYRRNREGDSETAIEYYQKAIGLRPNDTVLYENLGLAYENIRRWPEAEEAYKRFLAIDQADHYIRARLVAVQIMQGQEYYRAALDNILLCNEQDPGNLLYLQYLGEIYERLGEDDKALEIYKSMLAKDPENEYANNRAGIVCSRKMTEEGALQAVEFYKKAIAANGSRDGIYYENLGQVYVQLQNLKEAEKAFQKSIELNPELPDSYNRLGVLYFQEDRHAEAVIQYQNAIRRDSSNPVFYANLGLAFVRLEDLNQAETAFLKAVALDPLNPEYLNYAGVFFIDHRNDYKRSLEFFEKAISIDPGQAVYFKNAALAYELMGDLEKAGAAYEKAEQLSPEKNN